jgi:hypothetical protein
VNWRKFIIDVRIAQIEGAAQQEVFDRFNYKESTAGVLWYG